MITITTWNMKGGTGKTTTTFNLATNYARAGKKVLCIDLDIQANLTAFFEKDMHKRKADIKQVLEKSVSVDKAICHSRHSVDFISGCNKRSSMGICWKYGILYVGTCFYWGFLCWEYLSMHC